MAVLLADILTVIFISYIWNKNIAILKLRD